MYKGMYKLVFLPLAVLLLVNSAYRINAECTEDGLDCILDEECCTGYCDWGLSIYPYTGACGPRPSGPTPPKPCIPLYSGGACVYNVTCCQGYCERRYSAEGFCYVGPPLGDPPIESPAPVANVIAPISSPIDSEIAPSPPLFHSGSVVNPIASPAPVPSSKKGSKKNHERSRKNGGKMRHVAPTPAPSRNFKHKIKKKHGNGKLKCERVHAPCPT
ncbi:hypothetical protein Leryth_018671 [Lithospermum erythrorhizon]|nr:hypothetical protein Leryth_018671 [Lithospermum erythrorhizon]